MDCGRYDATGENSRDGWRDRAMVAMVSLEKKVVFKMFFVNSGESEQMTDSQAICSKCWMQLSRYDFKDTMR